MDDTQLAGLSCNLNTADMENPSGFLSIKRFLFSVISKSAIAIYPRLPIFGRLRAAVAVIRNNNSILVIERADGRGFSFPGGLAYPWESFEVAMRREVKEETGLVVENGHLLFEYNASADIPCRVAVFEADGDGQIVESWEGSPRWLSVDEIRAGVLPSQAEIIDRLYPVHPTSIHR